MYSRQLKCWFSAVTPARLKRRIMAAGKIQLGFRTMSSNVALGEKNTPIIRPNGEIEACGAGAEAWGSGAGGGIVAMEVSFGSAGLYVGDELDTYESEEKYHRFGWRGTSGTAARRVRV